MHSLIKELNKDKEIKPGSNGQKIKDFYASGMNSIAINNAKFTPLNFLLNQVAAINTPSDAWNTIANLQTKAINPAFGVGSGEDLNDSSKVILWLGSGGLGLPNRDDYFDEDKAERREKYLTHLKNMFVLRGYTSEIATKKASQIMSIETKLADATYTKVQSRNPQLMNNPTNLAGLKKDYPELDWDSYFKIIGLENPGVMNLENPGYFKRLAEMMGSVKPEEWKSYLEMKILRSMSRYLHEEVNNEVFDFYGKTIRGQKEQLPRWQRVLTVTSDTLGEAIGQQYVEKYFPTEAKKQALEIVMLLKETLGEQVKQLEWMSEKTKKKAIEKLEGFGIKIGYPDKWENYDKLKISDISYAENALQAMEIEYQKDIEKIGKPTDKTRWEMTPQTVNAYYHPLINEIVFPAAILQFPFFDPNVDPAINFGGMGAVIGHEITHGFDDQGRQFDATGNLKDWWTKEDAERFTKRADVLVSQFNAETVNDKPVNGKLTLGENIADLGGLKISWLSFQKYMQTHNINPQEKINGFTHEERFFLSWAQVWRTIKTKEAASDQIENDPHSPENLRCNIPLSNMPEFYRVFKLQKGDKLYREDVARAQIW